ncbi:MAG: hypothetical protein ACK48P_07725 [Holosporales bacterium]
MAAASQDARTARLAAALRVNLRKRKESELGVVSNEWSAAFPSLNNALKQESENTTHHSPLTTHHS